MPAENFNQTIKFWIDELDRYSFIQLRTKPSPTGWSIGQVYIHLIENTQWFLEQVNTCMSSDSNSSEDATDSGRMMLLNDDFPDELLEGPPENANTQQPQTKEELVKDLKDLQAEINRLSKLITKKSVSGKIPPSTQAAMRAP